MAIWSIFANFREHPGLIWSVMLFCLFQWKHGKKLHIFEFEHDIFFQGW